MNRSLRRLALGAMAGCAIAASAPLAWADDKDANDGVTRDWGAQWWQWIASIPSTSNPLIDTSGKDCMVGQHGPVWFLVGAVSGSASRSCSIPEGVTLFFPVANYIFFDTPGVCQDGPLTVAELRAGAAAFVDTVTQRSVTIDSRPVKAIRRLRSSVFPVTVPSANFFTSNDCPLPAAVYPRSVDDGYYAKVDNLSPGTHTLQIVASGAKDFNLNVTYTLTVVPRDRTREHSHDR